METNDAIQQAANAIRAAKIVAVSSGAGISAESGVPTFREAQIGLWARYRAEDLATPQAFLRNPDMVWGWYMHRLDLVEAVEPNPGHFAVAELNDLVPMLHVITQNVDGLHAIAGTPDPIELHGNIRRYRCFDRCRGHGSYVDLATLEYSKDKAPTCPDCGIGLVRPDVVWFGEGLPAAALNRANNAAQSCDVMLVVGTSGFVQPAASLPGIAKDTGATIIEVNPAHTMISSEADIIIREASGDALPRIIKALHG